MANAFGTAPPHRGGQPPLSKLVTDPSQLSGLSIGSASVLYQSATTVASKDLCCQVLQLLAAAKSSSPAPPPARQSPAPIAAPPHVLPRRAGAPQLRSQSLSAADGLVSPTRSASLFTSHWAKEPPQTPPLVGNATPPLSGDATSSALQDPFDAEWASLPAQKGSVATNPFVAPNAVKAFEVHL
ncbi:hypothetical protein HPB51_012635 [Rhipicephalus microplus]|uniref:Uncharacterized protein n=1 Tax=Rhipicephalus microplus TaxID=6941 RepID=A0A9J6E1L4_RHIMP|nr:hypothetical protein HPB51_012635 [Rhipicephalus microplus]